MSDNVHELLNHNIIRSLIFLVLWSSAREMSIRSGSRKARSARSTSWLILHCTNASSYRGDRQQAHDTQTHEQEHEVTSKQLRLDLCHCQPRGRLYDHGMGGECSCSCAYIEVRRSIHVQLMYMLRVQQNR